jgi:WD repeat-containing protein 1 (actin-interacting protein 1)
VRVWAYTHPEQLLKYELPSIGGEIEDVAWDSESKRIAAVGGGSAKAKIFSWDAGSQLGEIVPHTKKNLTVDFKPTRPFRVVLGGEDFQLSFYQGPPFR